MNIEAKYDAVFACPFGGIGINLIDDTVTSVDFIYQPVTTDFYSSTTAKLIARQLKTYFQNPECRFDCEIKLEGTPFQKKVWQELKKIPSGQTRTYGELARKLKSSPRAVGNACRRNPVPLIVPCHRVVAKNGLGGFAGQTSGETVNAKQWLLNYEAKI